MKPAVAPRILRPFALALVATLLLCLHGCAHNATCSNASCAQDAQITQQIQTLFRQHTEFQNQLSVRTVDRVVYLNGQAATDFQRDSAASLARGVSGVDKVVNNIYVNNPR